MKVFHWSHAVVAVIASTAILTAGAWARSNGPPGDVVRLCGNASGCDSGGCHSPRTASNATISFGLVGSPTPAPLPAAGYMPGTQYQLLLKIVEDDTTECSHAAFPAGCASIASVPQDACLFGFQITSVVWDMPTLSCAPGPTAAGMFLAPLGPDPEQKLTGVALPFLEHTNCGILPTMPVPIPPGPPSVPQEREWVIDWISPPPGTGPIAFFYGVNSANGNRNSGGDTPYFDNVVWNENTGPVACDLVTSSVASAAPPVDWLGSLLSDAVTCAPDPVPANVAVAGFSALATADLSPTGDALEVFQVLCSCTGTLLVADQSGMTHFEWVP